MQDGGPSPAEHGRAEESAGMGARLLDLSDVAASRGPTSSEQMPRAAIGRGSGLGRVGRGAAGREGWGRGANGFWRGRGAGGGPPRLPGPCPGTLWCSARSPGLPIPRSPRGLGLRGRETLVLRPPASPVCKRSARAASERRPPGASPLAGGRGASGPVRGRGGAQTALRDLCGGLCT